MKSKIKISFILGIYNAERTLEDCLNSIFMQDFPIRNYEVIIIDGGSTDSTLKIISNFMKKYSNIKLLHNPKKLSEGKGMSKDIGVNTAKGEIVIFLDHDNIILEKNWMKDILFPLTKNNEIMASQSLLKFQKDDTNFIKYINAIGVEDPFAVPYSLVSQIQLNPQRFKLINRKYYLYTLNKKNVLFFGANGCAFRKEVFKKIDGYTRDVDVSNSMAEFGMKVAVPISAYVYHKTSSDFKKFLKKKEKYFSGFFKSGYKYRRFNWIKPGIKGKIKFFFMVLFNLSIVGPFFSSLKLYLKTEENFWLLHPYYLFIVTLRYCYIGLLNFNVFLRFSKKVSSQYFL